MESAVKTRTLSWVVETLEELGQLKRANLFGHDDEEWSGATIDSRGQCSRRVFFALVGEQTDGHRFAQDASAKGSCAAVIQKDDIAEALARSETPFLLVDDVLAALQELSRVYRNTLEARVIAITGSAGKTTTKEYIRLVLKKKYKVYSNPGNLNNHIGVPLTLLETDRESEYLVSEIGANHLGEVDFLARILRPDIGVITNIGDAHIGLFGSREKIAEAKRELLECIEPEGYAILPRDDDYFDLLSSGAKCRVVTFGSDGASDFRISDVEDDEDRIHFQINDQTVTIRSFGTYNILNAAAAFVVGDVCGVESERARQALVEAEPVRGRARVHRVKGVVLIDDSYNANPTSMRASIGSLERIDAKRRIAILGDMAELGSFSDSEHQELGAFIGRSSIDRLYWLGNNGRHVSEGIGVASKKTVRLFDSLEDLCAAVEADLQTGDVVLVKASRSASLERAVKYLEQSLGKEDAS